MSRQLMTFGGIGLATNGFSYGVYLLLTVVHLSPLVAMTLAFIVGLATSYMANSRYTFRARRSFAGVLRMVICYLAAYAANFWFLWYCVSIKHWPHQGVQAGLMVVIGVVLFFAQKYWVFGSDSHGDARL